MRHNSHSSPLFSMNCECSHKAQWQRRQETRRTGSKLGLHVWVLFWAPLRLHISILHQRWQFTKWLSFQLMNTCVLYMRVQNGPCGVSQHCRRKKGAPVPSAGGSPMLPSRQMSMLIWQQVNTWSLHSFFGSEQTANCICILLRPETAEVSMKLAVLCSPPGVLHTPVCSSNHTHNW